MSPNMMYAMTVKNFISLLERLHKREVVGIYHSVDVVVSMRRVFFFEATSVLPAVLCVDRLVGSVTYRIAADSVVMRRIKM